MGRLKTIGPRLATLNAAPVRVLHTKAGASERVRGSAWMARKAAVQVRDCFTCANCGLVRDDHDVDHIVPLEQGGDPMAMNNLQLLCSGPDRCHAKKTAREAGLRAGRLSR
ncbi:HNH endonuclease [Acidovorax sp.]|uniref:HNH endonuclease n=1 Tax=Acidovorax sp. TaxID=1872122 RepID=UPI002ACE5191|nr:HNH endonuclease [Acidovorax sp.]MDZ7863372.1 HNH endonuclease [Acidovorax sp.]